MGIVHRLGVRFLVRNSQTPVNTDTEGVKCLYSERVEFRENVRVFFSQGRSKLPVIMRCPNQAGAGVRKRVLF